MQMSNGCTSCRHDIKLFHQRKPLTRVDSRARECENPTYFVILAHNCDLGAPKITQSTKKWRIFVSYVRRGPVTGL